ncbi:MAG TPA: hypothetical protein VHE30_15675 [Polyangiaceae bacterium]|nr:hypothetical protein [Polyangiaceae bacterium]
MLPRALSPFASLSLLLAGLSIPALGTELFLPRFRTTTRTVVACVTALFAAFAAIRAAAFLVELRPEVQGTDFFYFLCFARDWIDGIPVTELSFAYFPGIYAFYRLALRVGHQDLGVVQWAYVLVLAGNAAALGVAVGRTVRRFALGALAAVAYVAAASRLEGGFGIAEPVGTLPLAIAVAVWAGEPLRGRRGVLLALVLGAGIGLAVFVKQQCALQAAGWGPLVLATAFTPRESRHEPRALLLVPAAAIATFLIGVLSQGFGLMPIRVGLEAIPSYQAHASFMENLGVVFGRVGPLALAGLISAPIVVYFTVRRAPNSEHALNVAAFALGSAGGSLLQFIKRGYAHYGLVTVPWLVLLAAIGLALLHERAPERVRESSAAQLGWLSLAALSFVQTDPRARHTFALWPDPLSFRAPALGHRWREREMVGDLAQARRFVHPGEDVLVLPPRHNEVHFLLGTRSLSFAEHYAWAGMHTGNTLRALKSKTLSAVIVLPPRGQTDDAVWRDHDCTQAVAALSGNGFRRALNVRSLSVWVRN